MKFGIKESEVKEYWADRSEKQGLLTCGYGGNKSTTAQKLEYNEKIDFVAPHLKTDLPTIDYGCGVGRWSFLFPSKSYVGMDIEGNLLEIAKSRNPKKNYLLLESPSLTELEDNVVQEFQKASQFFSACVFQHCNDELVLKILKNLYDIKSEGIRFVLYENIEVKLDHVAGRRGQDYVKLFTKAGYKVDATLYAHKVHNEKHGLSVLIT